MTINQSRRKETHFAVPQEEMEATKRTTSSKFKKYNLAAILVLLDEKRSAFVSQLFFFVTNFQQNQNNHFQSSMKLWSIQFLLVCCCSVAVASIAKITDMGENDG